MMSTPSPSPNYQEMAAHDQKPSTKGVMYVYKLDTGNSKHEPKPPLPEVIKKGIARSWAGVLRRSKTYRENDHELNRRELMIQEARKSVPIFEDQEEERKSVAKYEEGRKSVSSQLEAIRKLATSTSTPPPRVETKVASVAALLQVKIMVTDMPGFMQVHAFRCARQTYDSLEKFSAKHMAHNLKKEFDKVYGPAWHCIVGSSFGSFVTHATGCFLYFSIEKLYILVFKTKVQKSLK